LTRRSVGNHNPRIKLTDLVDSWVFLLEEDSMTKTISAAAERQLERRAKHKLAVLRHVEEVSGNVSATCRYYGISRQAYYRWLKRFDAEGHRRAPRSHQRPTPFAEGDKRRGGREDPLVAPAVSLRAAEDRNVSEALSRHHDQLLRGVADPAQGRPGPAAGIAALQTQRHKVETLRETATRARPAGRCDV
jgi:transposase-like protein